MQYYIKTGKRDPYVNAPYDVVNAVKNPCAHEFPHPGSKCPPNAYQNAPIKFKNNRTDEADDWTAEIIMNGKADLILGTNNNADILQYNNGLLSDRWRESNDPVTVNSLWVNKLGLVRYDQPKGGAKKKKI